ncbi:TEF transcription factor, PAR bZIP family member b [Thalassophryne amazonica]|uniref:TEF transcription factor, PAR bZIP family member b n=1 Tax=Thalassophryne amazonica TaxID=390379 RepID=UPI001470972A|nr:TEF transcription factor, PAR bZIP family member b [Thalassophryne amazonica]
MPGTVALQTGASDVKADPHKSFSFALKTIMDIPPPIILEEGDDDLGKEKLCSSEDVEGSDAGAAGVGGGSRGGSGVSASLTPAIWEKTIPYDGETFHLEYMDLDEFLLENGIPMSLEEEDLQKTLISVENKSKCKTAAPSPPPTPAPPSDAAGSILATTPASTTSAVRVDPEEAVTVTTLQPAKLEEEDDEEQEQECLSLEAKTEVEERESKSDGNPADRNTPSPIDPDAIEVDVNFQPDPTDLVLSSVPGGELFNPRKHKFSEEDLKPQPMIKKAKKVYVPDEQKDEKYWSRRKKNNLAAKRSRDARRLKENQITVRASFLERENTALRQQVSELRKDCGRCKNIMARYEVKYGPL